MFTNPVKEKIREVYQEYDRYIVYNVYDENKNFLYRETESKIKTRPDLTEESDEATQELQNWINKKISVKEQDNGS